MTSTRARGFTLIELLVAVAIFAAIAAIAYGSVTSLIRARDQLRNAEARLQALQTAFIVFERDIRSAVGRPVREPYGESRAALIGERSGIALTRLRSGGLADASPQTQRVAYTLDAGTWNRGVWPVIDAAPSTQPRIRPLLGEVEGVSLRYLDAQGRWREVWPAAEVGARGQLDVLPRAIEMRVKLADLGELRRIIELPQPAPAVIGESQSPTLPP